MACSNYMQTCNHTIYKYHAPSTLIPQATASDNVANDGYQMESSLSISQWEHNVTSLDALRTHFQRDLPALAANQSSSDSTSSTGVKLMHCSIEERGPVR